ncbi:zinc-dependent alcohol dehydrogenase [Microbacterium sp. RD1]|uniref:zinc-dependent alcohol dehydrogenase n=1 Tax=Microbacterium sp. RD1 TaxID=3457313 RepID=UPI003FA5F652
MTSATMRAAVYHGPHDVRIERRPIPTPGPGEMLLRVGAVGVCGSDAGEYDHGPVNHPLHVRHPASGHLGPIIPGHEFSGTVIALGDGVDPGWLERTVASCGLVACGRCRVCTEGRSNLCESYYGSGLHVDGALAEYVLARPENSVAVDDLGLTLAEAALAQPLAIAVHDVSRAGPVTGRSVLVQGAGGIGAFLVHALVQEGAHVVVTDLDEDRLDIARELGADATIRVAGTPDDVGLIRDRLPREVSVLFEVTGAAGGLRTAIDLAPRGGVIVLVGLAPEPVAIDAARLALREIALVGTNALVRERDFPRAVELLARRAGDWGRVAPRVLPLTDLVEGALRPMAERRAAAIKYLIDPHAELPRDLYDTPPRR